MDRFDRCVAWFITAVALGGGALLISRGWHHASWAEIVLTACVAMLLARWPWITIPKQSRDAKILASICGDCAYRVTDGGRLSAEPIFCVLEPGHPGDHKNFHSSGGMIGWPRKGGA